MKEFVKFPSNYAKSLVRAFTIFKIFPGVIPPDPRLWGKEGTGGDGRGGEGKGEGGGREREGWGGEGGWGGKGRGGKRKGGRGGEWGGEGGGEGRGGIPPSGFGHK